MTSSSTRPGGATSPEQNQQRRQWQEWHAQRERDLARPHDWLSISAFHWVTATSARPEALADVPGRWAVDDGALTVQVDAGAGLHLLGEDGRPQEVPASGISAVTVPESGSVRFAQVNEVVVEVIRRGGHYALRLRDPHARTRTEFPGVPIYDYDSAYVLPVTITAYDEPRPVQVGTAAPGLIQSANTVGEVRFEIDGVAHTLTATGRDQSWHVSFSDASAGVETSQWRAVPVQVTAPGTGVIDFNRAANFPYAFTDFGTCPRPVAGNHLPVAVRAGEKAPAGRPGVPPTTGGPTALPGNNRPHQGTAALLRR